MSNYYTPTIDSFRPGFEYELKTPDGWQHCIYGEVSPAMGWVLPFNQDGEFVAELVRVKYLDREDIKEALPSSDIKMIDGDLILRIDKDPYSHVMIEYDLSECRLFIEEWYQSKMIGSALPEDTRRKSTLFNGTIKNKSELKVLLKQLNIL